MERSHLSGMYDDRLAKISRDDVPGKVEALEDRVVDLERTYTHWLSQAYI